MARERYWNFTGTFDYAVSSTVLPTASSTLGCLHLPLVDLSGVQILTPTVFYVPPQRPPEGKVSLYPWQLDYPSEEAFKLGLAVLLNDPTVASATQSLSELMDKNHIYVANPQCFNLKMSSRIKNLETHLTYWIYGNDKEGVVNHSCQSTKGAEPVKTMWLISPNGLLIRPTEEHLLFKACLTMSGCLTPE